MKKYFIILSTLFFLGHLSTAQNVLDNLKLAEQFQINFESSKFNLSEEANQQLQAVVDKCRRNSSLKLRITAHTDGQGNAQSNYILADKRANAVKYFLISKGITPDILVASTFGQDKPLADNDSEEGRKQNRRAMVEIYEPAPEKVVIVEKEKQIIIEKEKAVYIDKPYLQPSSEKITETPSYSIQNEVKSFEENKPYLQGVVMNAETTAPVKAHIFVHYLNGRIDSFFTDNKGVFKLLCVFDEQVTMDIFAKGYFYASQDVVIKPNLAQKIELQPLAIGSVTAITNLYFVGDEATLLKTSDRELAKILRFMELNKGIKIEIAGHVNAPGIDPDKLPQEEFELSEGRANAIRTFLINNGFASDNIDAKGYGNAQMRYPEPTTERQEELNRRVEIKVLDIK